MQDGKGIPADEAGQWLRKHFEGDPSPSIDITWEITPPDDRVFEEVLHILFAPEPGEAAA